jgi:hypothetical protein
MRVRTMVLSPEPGSPMMKKIKLLLVEGGGRVHVMISLSMN